MNKEYKEVIINQLGKFSRFSLTHLTSLKNIIIEFLLCRVESYRTMKQDKIVLKKRFNELLSLQAVNSKYSFISDILAAKPSTHHYLEEFKKVKNEFIEFANNENSLANEAEMILNLQSIEKELSLMTSFSDIYNKNIIAIGGGFSSGKSSFVSSFFTQKDISLPIGINPVTAIPSYIISGNNNTIKGYSKEGGSFNIDRSMYEELSHDFVQSFSFNIKDIMPMMAIETPLDGFESICFIDTPGYDPAKTEGFTSEDKNTAYEFLQQANSLLWLVGLDANGTIPESDLSFLESLNLTDTKLYVVANKADLRAESDLEDIIVEIEESLEDYDIEFEGVSAYSANLKQEYLSRKMPLTEFLQSENKPAKLQENIQSRVKNIINAYKEAINEDLGFQKNIRSSFKSIELDLLSSGYDYTDEEQEDDGFSIEIEKNKIKEKLIEIKILWGEIYSNYVPRQHMGLLGLYNNTSEEVNEDDLLKSSKKLVKIINKLLKMESINNYPNVRDHFLSIKKYISKLTKKLKETELAEKDNSLKNFLVTLDETLVEINSIENNDTEINKVIARVYSLQKSLETSKTKELNAQLKSLEKLENDFQQSIDHVFEVCK